MTDKETNYKGEIEKGREIKTIKTHKYIFYRILTTEVWETQVECRET